MLKEWFDELEKKAKELEKRRNEGLKERREELAKTRSWIGSYAGVGGGGGWTGDPYVKREKELREEMVKEERELKGEEKKWEEERERYEIVQKLYPLE